MSLNRTKAELTQKAIKELAKKMKLEASMINKLNKLFDNIADDIELQLIASGGIPGASAYEREFAKILNEQYQDVQSQFTGEIMDYLDEEAHKLGTEHEPKSIGDLGIVASAAGLTLIKLLQAMKQAIQTGLKAFRQQQVPSTAKGLVTTTQKDIEYALTKASANIKNVLDNTDTDGNPLPSDASLSQHQIRRSLAKEAKQVFKQHTAARPKTIAVTETQKSAEATKDIERNVFAERRNAEVLKHMDKKVYTVDETWITVGDNVVRPWHLAADFQEKKDGVYVVKGQRLRYPGDATLGATADNVIGCRCSSISQID